jgi:chromosome partitioning protein
MILLFGGQKGGTGKATLAMNASVALARAGHTVLLVDTDSQLTVSNWADKRSNEGLSPAITCIQKTGRLSQVLSDMRGRYDHIVVDAGGRDSVELRSALTLADKLYTPLRPSQNDLWTLDQMSELVENARDINERLSAHLILTLVPTNPMVRELQNARAMLADYPAFSPCQTVIYDRKAYRDAVFLGKGVLEHHDAKASAEVESFIREVFPHDAAAAEPVHQAVA